MPKFGSEPRFEPEPLGPNPKFGSRFRAFAEPNPRSSSRFSQSERFEPEPNLGLKLAGNPLIFPEFWAQNCARYDI